jgi:dynein intermediate chain 2, axonemal
MTDAYTYQKKRKEFGRHAQFEDTDTKIVGSVPPDPNCKDKFIERNPNKIVLSNVPQYSEHSVNTERIPTSNKGMKHSEGGKFFKLLDLANFRMAWRNRSN